MTISPRDTENADGVSAPALDPQDERRVRSRIRDVFDCEARRLEPVPAGLGHRRFLRVTLPRAEPASLIARIDAPPASEPSTPPPDDGLRPITIPEIWRSEPELEGIRHFLENAGLPVPRSYGHFPEEGLDLLEDVGDRTLAAATGADRERLYSEAGRSIEKLQTLEADPAEIPAFGRHYDHALAETKCAKWLYWVVPLLLKRPPSPDEIQSHFGLFRQLSEIALEVPLRLSHRDFKAENLHWLSDDRLVMIDVQGAFMAPPEYDWVCLLNDLQVDLPSSLIEGLSESAFQRGRGEHDASRARLRFDALTILRVCKDVAHVVHAGRVRGDMRRWNEIPRGLDLIRGAVTRLSGPIADLRALSSVIHALTEAVKSTDSSSRGDV